MTRRSLALTFAALLAITVGRSDVARGADAGYTPSELRTLKSLWIGSLGPPPDDPSNAYDTDPRAARLGRRIFFDTRFSANGKLACVSCHDPKLGFQDGKPLAEGLERQARRSMPLVGVAHNTWFFWDGRKDSLWAQAMVPLENPSELGVTRPRAADLVAAHYRGDYEAIFGPMPGEPRDADATTRVFVNIAKAIAAFVRTIQPEPARFDRYAEAVLSGDQARAAGILRPEEVRGLRLFIGRAQCTNCHSGPLFTNGEFHFTRVPKTGADLGRGAAITMVLEDEFNCGGRFSDARPEQCTALRFIDRDTRESLHAFKTPSLRNVATRAPYMNAGQLPTLQAVLRFYRDGTRGMKELGHGDLTDRELADLEAFLRTLSGPIAALPAS